VTEAPAGPFVGSDFSDDDFNRVRDLLLEQRGFDLGMYKDQCIRRRIAARVRTLGMKDAAAYLRQLREDQEEPDALLAALTIHVSQFFRNPQIFALLEKEVLPALLARALSTSRRQVRLWSVGCAGGEEPYSLALLCEHQALRGIRVSILGTDVSPLILNRARTGYFEPLRVSAVPPDTLNNYFLHQGRGFRLIERIRRKVEFRRHNVLMDEKFPAADLILCRNVLIYFSRGDQDRILHQFAEVLGPGGYLVLGTAENMLGSARDRFRRDFPAERIYRCRSSVATGLWLPD